MIDMEVRHHHPLDLLRLDARGTKLFDERNECGPHVAEQEPHREAEVLAQIGARIGMQPRIDQHHAGVTVAQHIRETWRLEHRASLGQSRAQLSQPGSASAEHVAVGRWDVRGVEDLQLDACWWRRAPTRPAARAVLKHGEREADRFSNPRASGCQRSFRRRISRRGPAAGRQ